MIQTSNNLAALRAEDHQCVSGIKCESAILQLERKGFTGLGRADRVPIPFELPFDWNGTDPDDRNWMFQLHAWRMLDPYLVLMLKDGGQRASFEHSVAVVTDWTRENVLGKPGPFTWYDMSTGIRASKLALLARAAPAFKCNLSATPGFDDMLAEHFTHLMNPKELNRGNHGLFQMQGLKSLSSAFSDHPASSGAKKYAVHNMSDLIEAQMGEYGVHTENSPNYHFFACNRISAILTSPDWQIPEVAFARELMTKGEKVKPWLTDVANRVVPIGDSSQRAMKPAELSSLNEWPHRTNADHMGAVLDGYGVVRSRPHLPVKNSSYLFLTASYHGNAHKHDDCLSFVWQEGGAELLIDPGKYGYQKGSVRAYFQGRRAHNTVEFNQLSLPRDKRRPYGSGMKEVAPLAGGAWSIRAEAPCSAEGDMHQRRLLFHPGRSLIIFDRIVPVGKEVNDYTLWWHFPPGAQLALDGSNCRVTGLADQRTLRILSTSDARPMTARVHEGEETPRLQGWVSPSYLRREPAPALGVSSAGRGAFHAVTVFKRESDIALPKGLSAKERALVETLNL